MRASSTRCLFILIMLMLHVHVLFAETLEEIQSHVQALSVTLRDVQKSYNQSLEKVSSLRKKISSQKKDIMNLEREGIALKARYEELNSELSEVQKRLSDEKELFKKFLSADFFNTEAEARFVALGRALSTKSKSLFQSLTNKEISLFYDALIKKRESLVRSIVESEKKILDLQNDLKDLEAEKVRKKNLLEDVLQKTSLDKSDADAELKTLTERKLQLEGVQGALKAKQLRLTVALGGLEERAHSAPTAEEKRPSLQLPVSGSIKREFNASRTGKSVIDRIAGVDFEVTSDEVSAAYSGKIRFVGVLKGFDSVVIIEHPGHYYTFYAPLEDVSVKVGDVVTERAFIGKVKNGEIFYFEVRKGQVSENPREFLASYLKP